MSRLLHRVCAAVAIAAACLAQDDPAVDAQTSTEDETQIQLPAEDVVARPWRDLQLAPLTESPGLDTALSIVTQADIERQGAYSVIDAMEYVPGAWVETRGRKVKQFFSLRGQRYPYPMYALNGAWQREFHEMPYFVSAANFERIEVLRSGSALLTGPGGTTGVINLVPRTYDTPQTTMEASFGRWNTTTAHIGHGASTGTFDYALGIGNRHTDGPRGDNAAENMTDAYLHLGAAPSETLKLSLDMFGIYGRREVEQARRPAADSFRQDLSRFDPYRALAAVGKAHYTPAPWTFSELIVNCALRDHTFVSASETAPERIEIDERDYEYGATFTQGFRLLPQNTLRVGALYNRWTAPDGKRFYVGRRSELETFSWVVVGEQELGPLTVNAGYRWSRTYIHDFGAFNIDGQPSLGLRNVQIKNQWDPPTHHASAGAVYHINDTFSLHANCAGGQVEARTGTVSDGGGRPDPETRWQFDVGLKTQIQHVGEATLTPFYVLQRDGIALIGTGRLPDGRWYELYTNRDQRQYGLELDVRSARAAWGGQVFFNAMGMRSRQEKTAGRHWERNKQIPQVILAAGVHFQRGRFDGGVFAKYISQYEEVRFLPRGSRPEKLGDFVNLNANAGYAFGDKHQWRVFVAAENLLDDDYATAPGYPSNGIFASAGVRLTF